MSRTAVRLALQAAMTDMEPALDTVWGNKAFTPTKGSPYQRCTVLFAQPTNTEISASYFQEGFLQATLCYPQDKGPGPAGLRADLITSVFYRGRSLPPLSGIVTTITLTPEELASFDDGDRYCVPVRIPFSAQIAA